MTPSENLHSKNLQTPEKSFRPEEGRIGDQPNLNNLSYCNAEMIDSIAASEQQSNNLLFYNFNAYGA